MHIKLYTPPPPRMMNPLQCFNCIMNYSWNIIETKNKCYFPRSIYSNKYTSRHMAWLNPMWNASKVVCCYGIQCWSCMETCMCLHFDKWSDLLWDGPLISPMLCPAGHIVSAVIAGLAPYLCIVELSIDFYGNHLGPPWRLRWPTIRITSRPLPMKLTVAFFE